MAFTYADYEQQTTDSAKLTRLNLHIAEVRLKLNGNLSVSGGGMSVTYDSNNLAILEKRRDELEQRVRRYGPNKGPLSVADTRGPTR